MRKRTVPKRDSALEHLIVDWMHEVFASPLAVQCDQRIPLKAIMMRVPNTSAKEVLASLEALIKDGVVACAGDDHYRIASPPSGPGKVAALERRLARLEAIVARLDREVASITTTY